MTMPRANLPGQGSLVWAMTELDSGTMDLEKAIEAYEIGTKLKKHCEKKLKEAQERIEKIEVGEDGELNINPIDIKE